MKPINRARLRQAGFTLIETLITVAIMFSVFAFTLKQKRVEYEENRQQKMAELSDKLLRATAAHAAENADDLVRGNPVAGFANPRAPTVAELIARRYLVTGFQPDPGLFGPGTWQTAIDVIGVGGPNCNPPADFTGCELHARVWVDQPLREAGQASQRAAGGVASKLGAFGGATDLADTTQIRFVDAAGGGAGALVPTVANPLAGNPAGVLMARMSLNNQTNGAFLRMNDPRAVTLGNTLQVAGATTVGGQLNAQQALQVSGQLTALASAIVNGDLQAGPGGTLRVTGAGAFMSRAEATELLALTSFTSQGTSTLLGDVNPTGNPLSVRGNLSAAGNTFRANADGTITLGQGGQAAQACSSIGQMTRDDSGGLLQCKAGLWEPIAGADQLRPERISTNASCRNVRNDLSTALFVTAGATGGGTNVYLAINGNMVANSGGFREGGGSSTFVSTVVAPGETVSAWADNTTCLMSVIRMGGKGIPADLDTLVRTDTSACGAPTQSSTETYCEPMGGGVGALYQRNVTYGQQTATDVYASGRTIGPRTQQCYVGGSSWQPTGLECMIDGGGGGGVLP